MFSIKLDLIHSNRTGSEPTRTAGDNVIPVENYAGLHHFSVLNTVDIIDLQ